MAKLPVARETAGLAVARAAEAKGEPRASVGEKTRREPDDAAQGALYELYVEAEQTLYKVIRAHAGGHLDAPDVGAAHAAVDRAWAAYVEAKGHNAPITKALATISLDGAGEVDITVLGGAPSLLELPDVMEKAVRLFRNGMDAKESIGEGHAMAYKHLHRLYLLYFKKGLEMIQRVVDVVERRVPGLKAKPPEDEAKKSITNILAFPFSKAVAKPISAGDVERLVKEVQDHTYAFAVNYSGWHPPAETLARLRSEGLIAKDAFSFPANAYSIQRVVDILESAGKDPNKVTFEHMLSMARVVPTTALERAQVAYLEREGARHITGLGNGIAKFVGRHVDHGDATLRYQEFIRGATKEGTLRRWGWQGLSSELGRATQNWARDWDRIAKTELQNARQHAIATKIAKDNDGDDPLVYKMPRRTACRYCIELYLRGSNFNRPRVFRLSTLAANGENYGRKVAEWKPTLGCLHPNCRCETHEYAGTLDGETHIGAMGDIVAEQMSLYGRVTPRVEDKELAAALMQVKITLDGIPIEELR